MQPHKRSHIIKIIKAAYDMPIIVSHTSPFAFAKRAEEIPGELIGRAGQLKCALFRDIQRALGATEGTIISFDKKSRQGQIKIGRLEYEFVYSVTAGNLISRVVGVKSWFSFWPTQKANSVSPVLPQIKIPYVRMTPFPINGYIEAVGLLTSIEDNQMSISLWSQYKKELLSVILSGQYKNPDDINKFVWVFGNLDMDSGMIKFLDAEPLEFVDAEYRKVVYNALKRTKHGNNGNKRNPSKQNSPQSKASQKDI